MASRLQHGKTAPPADGMPAGNDPQVLSDVLPRLAEISRQAADQPYLCRGEPKGYDQVSSGLYRHWGQVDPAEFLLDTVQEEFLDEVARLAPALAAPGPGTILAHLQPYGFQTNCIDFTSDFRVALFLACDEETDATGQNLKHQDGRLVLLARNKTEPCSPWARDKAGQEGEFASWGRRKPGGLTRRAKAQRRPGALEIPEEGTRIHMQKSVLAHAPVGFVEPDRSITIPRAAQNSLLQYLARCPHIKAATMYHAVHGFIR